MASVGKISKFSVLKIDDDSDQEFSPVVTAGKKKPVKKTGGSKPVVTARNGSSVHLSDGLVVHAVGANKKKATKAKAKVIDEATGFVVQDAGANYNEEKRYQDQLKEALRESEQAAQAAKEENEQLPEDRVVAQLSKDLDKSNSPSSLIRQRMLELHKACQDARVEADEAKEKAEDYKRRYKRVVSILYEAEVQERAELAKKLVISRTVEADLSEQIASLREDLEKARSKIHQLESRLNK